MFLFFMIYHLIHSGNFKGSEIRHEIFGGYFLVQGFLAVLLEALRIFLGFEFCPHFDHPCHLKSKVPP